MNRRANRKELKGANLTHIRFLCKCRDNNVNPTFAKLKQLKQMQLKVQQRLFRRLIIDKISSVNKKLKEISE